MLYDTQAPSTHRSTAGKLMGVSDTARMGQPIENYLFGQNTLARALQARLVFLFYAVCSISPTKKFQWASYKRT